MSKLSLYEIAQKAKASGTRKGLALADRYSKIYAKCSELNAKYSELSAKASELDAKYSELSAKRSELDAKASELVDELTAWAHAAR